MSDGAHTICKPIHQVCQIDLPKDAIFKGFLFDQVTNLDYHEKVRSFKNIHPIPKYDLNKGITPWT